MVKAHGLKSPQPIMGSYYVSNPIEGAIWEIVTSMDLEDIVTQIAKLEPDR